MKKWYFLILLFGGFTLNTWAQPPADSLNTLVVDTTEEKVPFFDFKSDYPNPNKAAILSFALPGAGQAYNKRWWKLPLVYGAFAGMFYAIDFNQGLYRRFRDALQLNLAGEEHEFSETVIDSPTALRGLRDQYDRNTQLSYIGTVLLYGIVAVEAFVDAHLLQFDIDEDLSMQIAPQVVPLPDEYGSAGVAVIIRF
jgi:hypothetical protein